MITIANRFEVKSGDVIWVPGCEPSSSITSATLAMYRQCHGSTVSIHAALVAIPGSYLEWMNNAGQTTGSRRKYFVLPATVVDCPTECMPDFYQILRDIARPNAQEEAEDCDTLDQGFLPEEIPVTKSAFNPYTTEGSLYGVMHPGMFNHFYGPTTNIQPVLEQKGGDTYQVAPQIAGEFPVVG